MIRAGILPETSIVPPSRVFLNVEGNVTHEDKGNKTSHKKTKALAK